MTLKEQILLKADENVIIREAPVPKPKKKKVKSKVKLSSLLEELLLEAVDVSDGSKVIKALERGQIPGVKKKVFLNTSFTNENIIDTLNNVLKTVKDRVEDRDFNKYVFLLLKRADNIETLDQFYEDELSIVLDSMTAYFKNKNKREAIEDEDTKKRFEAFESSKINLNKDKNFEQWVNDKFVEKAKAKKDDIEEVYSDDDGWKVFAARSFPEAKKLACMGDRKATWCTAASSHFFNTYASKEHPLYIIRNEKKNVMFQMDFGRSRSKTPNFKNEKDKSATIDEVKAAGVPSELLKSIKDPEGKSVFDTIEPVLQGKTPLTDTSSTPDNQLEGWSERVFSNLEEFLEDTKDYEAPSVLTGGLTIEDFLRGKEKTIPIKKIMKLTKGKSIIYCIIPNYSMRMTHGGRTKTLTNFALAVSGNRLVLKTAKSILESKLPDAIKKKLFTRITRRYTSSGTDVETKDEEKSIEKEDFQKSPNVQDLGNGFYTGIKTFADVVSLKLGEILTDLIKQSLMEKNLNLNDVVLTRAYKYNKQLVVLFVFKDGTVRMLTKVGYQGKRFFLAHGFPDDIKRFIGSKIQIVGDTKRKEIVNAIIKNLGKEIVFEKKIGDNTSVFVRSSFSGYLYRFSSRDKDVWKANQIAKDVIESDGEEVYRKAEEYERIFFDLFQSRFYKGV